MIHKPKRRKPIIIKVALVLVLLAALLLVLEKTKVINLYEKPVTGDTTTEEESFINLGPPTDEEKQAGDMQKDEILQSEP